MKKISLLIITVFFTIYAFAQNPTFTWGKKMGGTGTEAGQSVIVDVLGNVYTTGYFWTTTDFDPGAGLFNLTPAGQSDIFVSKLDASGNFVWAKAMGAAGDDGGYSITVDASGNVYTTGYFRNTVDFDPGAGVFNLTSAGNYDIFVSKLDASGNFVWAKRMGGTGNDWGQSIVVNASGNVFTTGYFGTTADFDPGAGVFNLTSAGADDIFISKLDASGNFVLAKSMGGINQDYGCSVSVDALGNIYSTGFYSGTVDFDPGAGVFNLTSVGGSIDVFVSKIDASGNFVWGKTMGSSGTDKGYSLALDASGNIYTTGYFNNTADFDPGAGVFNLSVVGFEDIFISKLDASGNFILAEAIGGANTDMGYSIALDASGNIYTAGVFNSTVDFDPGAGVFNLTSTGLQDIFISKLNPSGNFLWAGAMGEAAGYDVCYSIALDASRSIYTTGFFNNTVDFDPGAGVSNLTSAGNEDIFVHKMCQSPEQPAIINGSLSICAGSSPVYTINTLPGATSYTWVLPGGWSGAGTSNTINPTVGSSGTISVSGVNACGTGLSQTITVMVNPLPTITVNSGSICSGNSFTIVPGGANTYTIQGGSAIVSPTVTTSYSIAGSNTAGCVSTSPAISGITVNALPNISASTSTAQLCIGSSATLTASGGSTYTWNPGGAGSTIVISPTVNTTYTLTGIDLNTCQNSTVITQNVINCSSTGLTPLSEGEGLELMLYPNPTNDEFTIKGIDNSIPIKIYNSIGQEVASTSLSFGEGLRVRLDQPNGIYFMRIGTVTKKIIKQ